MRIYLDTEFIARPNYLELISIALVKEDTSYYYAVSSEFSEKEASDWVKEHVFPQLEPENERKSLLTIQTEMVEFIGYQIPEIWAYYASFDWVAVMWLYGGMKQLPVNFPLYCRELKQEIDRLKFPRESLPKNPQGHHALADARWNYKVHKLLLNYENLNNDQNLPPSMHLE